MAAYWIFASFFISMEFYLFKKPIYCDHPFETDSANCCKEGDAKCGEEICLLYPHTIKEHIFNDNSMTYQFGLYCGSGHEWLRIVLKVTCWLPVDFTRSIIHCWHVYLWVPIRSQRQKNCYQNFVENVHIRNNHFLHHPDHAIEDFGLWNRMHPLLSSSNQPVCAHF